MPGTRTDRVPRGAERQSAAAEWRLSDGEIHYLWWYIQGSIMEPDVRQRLRRAWGFCGRHAWGALSVEAAFRPSFLHGPAVLYEDLMTRALRVFDLAGPWQAARVARRLRPTGPCLMCDMGLNRSSPAMAREELLAEGRDVESLRRFATKRRRFWWNTVCGQCLGEDSTVRCRPHLREDLLADRITDPGEHRGLVEWILRHVTVYSRSFRWESRMTDTEEDQAALISAVGWCSGWEPWLPLLR